MSLERDIDAAKKLLLRHGYIIPDKPANEEELRVHYWRIELTMAIGRFLGDKNPGDWDLETHYSWGRDQFMVRVRRIIRGLDGSFREKRGGLFALCAPFDPNLPDTEMVGRKLAYLIKTDPILGGLPVVSEGSYYLTLFTFIYEDGKVLIEEDDPLFRGITQDDWRPSYPHPILDRDGPD